MRALHGVLGAFAVAFLLVSGPARAASPEEEVRATFEDYRNALQDRQGDIAGFLVTPETLEFYGTAAGAALYAPSEGLATLPLVQQLLALRLREAFPPERILGMTLEEVVAASVDQGLLKGRGVRDLTLGPVTVEGDRATAPQVDPWGRDIGVTWAFRKEDGLWRVDLRPSLMAADALLQAMQRERGLSRDAFLIDLVSRSIGRVVDESLLTPPLTREAAPETSKDGG